MATMEPRRSKVRMRGSRWMVERERHRIEDARPPAPDRAEQQVGDVVGAILKRLGLDAGYDLAGMAEAWPALVGEAVARHTRPGQMVGTELVVYVDSSVWLSELSRGGLPLMLSKVQQRFGRNRVRSVRLQLDPGG